MKLYSANLMSAMAVTQIFGALGISGAVGAKSNLPTHLVPHQMVSPVQPHHAVTSPQLNFPSPRNVNHGQTKPKIGGHFGGNDPRLCQILKFPLPHPPGHIGPPPRPPHHGGIFDPCHHHCHDPSSPSRCR